MQTKKRLCVACTGIIVNTWREKTKKLRKFIEKNITKHRNIKRGVKSGMPNGFLEMELGNGLTRMARGMFKIIGKKLMSVINFIYGNILKFCEKRLSRNLAANVLAVERKIIDSSQSTILTETVDNIAYQSAALHERFISNCSKRGMKSIKYKYSVSTAIWEDNLTVVKIKYALTS